MASNQGFEGCQASRKDNDEKQESPKSFEKNEEMVSSLPTSSSNPNLRQYKGFWFSTSLLASLICAQEHFKAQPSDIFLCTFPKSGTTWIKSLAFAIATRKCYKNHSSTNPLLTNSPHELITNIESTPPALNCDPDLPILATHFPYTCLPASIISSGSKIVYLCRDPKDIVVSAYHFLKKIPNLSQAVQLEGLLEGFCTGEIDLGPFWDHALGYWKASLENPGTVLFLKFEELKKDTETSVKRLAEFMGYPFSPEEESTGEVKRIVSLCSFQNLSNLEANKTGEISNFYMKIKRESFFRTGDIGGWKSYLSSEKAERLDKILEEKLSPFGLSLGASTATPSK